MRPGPMDVHSDPVEDDPYGKSPRWVWVVIAAPSALFIISWIWGALR